MKIDLSGKLALVTGAGSGIGAAVAQTFAAAGARVAVHARSLDSAAPTVEIIRAAGGDAFGVAGDLADATAVKNMCEHAIMQLHGIDIAMHNAGVYQPEALTEISEDSWERTMSVNLKAAVLMAKLTVPVMIRQKRGGRQLVTSSVSGKIAEQYGSAYCASKAGVNAMVRCLATEVGSHGITVNAICPGWVDTPMAHRAHAWMRKSGLVPDETYEDTASVNPLGVTIEPQDIANMAAFLASDKARCITGQAINVCAGLCVTN